MKRILLFSVLMVLASTAAQAETIRLKSKVGEVNTTAGFVRLFLVNPQRNAIEPIRVDVDRSTQFGGFDALRELSAGDEVYATVNYNEYRHEYKALQIGLLVKRGPGLISTPAPRYQPPLVSSGVRLFQNIVEEEPVRKEPIQTDAKKIGETTV